MGKGLRHVLWVAAIIVPAACWPVRAFGGVGAPSVPLANHPVAAAQMPVGPASPAQPIVNPPAPVTPAPAGAPPLGPSVHVPKGEMLFNFDNADIRAVIRTMAALTGKNFLVDPRVQGKVTIVSATPVRIGAAYQIFLAALKAQGFTAVSGPGGVVKILPQANARQAAPVSRRWPRGGDQLVTQIIRIRDGQAEQIVPLLRPLMSSAGVASLYAPTNTLIVTDYADNVRRLLRVVASVEAALRAPVTIVPLRYVSAVSMAHLLVRLGEGQLMSDSGAPIGSYAAAIIIPDPRDNSLLVRTGSASRLRTIERLVTRLDVQGEAGGTTHVVYLRNARATSLAKILRGLLEGEAKGAAEAGAVPAMVPVAMPPTAGAPGGASAPVSARAIKASLVQADPSINALIINAPDTVYNNLRAVIAKLDIRRAQVFVQALIAEVTTDNAAELGVQWAGAAPVGGSGAVGGITNFPFTGSGIVSTATTPSNLASEAGLALGYISGEETLANGQTVVGLSALARALESISGVNVLSTPDLLTLDNTEATIMVGQNVPFVTGSYATSAIGSTAVNPFQTIERKNVGLTLKIKPQITAGNNIKMDIYEDVSSIAPNVTGAADLITNKRELKTTVIVADGHTIVLGGLIDDELDDTWQGVPLLDDIPFLGNLFRYRQRVKKKTDLMIFLKPVIVRSAGASEGFTASRYEFMQAEEGTMYFKKSYVLPNWREPRMPALRQPAGKPVAGARRAVR
ncbi:MAG: type II secretion system secretin GspD [Gammaproteobacteria bacterium]|nr:type II secretion system secretin GspD [Gammaproteobacteria bacterium]